MNRIFTFVFLFSALSVVAQDYVQISVGASYAQQAFYTISNDDINTLDNDSWDLAFATDLAGAGVLYNESAALSATSSLRMYLAPTNDFFTTIDQNFLTDSLYNGEASWDDGAFNSAKDVGNPFDFGWGTYDPMTHVVTGTRVFAIQLRNGSWKKIKIESLDGGIYSMKYADLDGANETTVTINKSDFTGSPLALFSFDTGNATASPTNWDLFFGRYLTPLDIGNGDITQYPVTGVLSAAGVEIAEARNIDPSTVDHVPYLDSMETRLDIIGSDWKFFNLDNFMWEIDFERAYFVKLPDNQLWKLVFIDFEGSSTGTTTIEKTSLGEVTSVAAPQSNFKEFGVFPNPVGEEFTVSFSLKERRTDIQLFMVNALGQRVWQQTVDANSDLNVFNIQTPNIPSGIYQMVMGQGTDVVTTTVFIK